MFQLELFPPLPRAAVEPRAVSATIKPEAAARFHAFCDASRVVLAQAAKAEALMSLEREVIDHGTASLSVRRYPEYANSLMTFTLTAEDFDIRTADADTPAVRGNRRKAQHTGPDSVEWVHTGQKVTMTDHPQPMMDRLMRLIQDGRLSYDRAVPFTAHILSSDIRIEAGGPVYRWIAHPEYYFAKRLIEAARRAGFAVGVHDASKINDEEEENEDE